MSIGTTSGRSVAIVGAGQAGLCLGIALAQQHFEVDLYTDRSAEQIRTGPVLSSQCMFGSSRAIEADLGLNLWDGSAPDIAGMRVSAYLPGMPVDPVLVWTAPLAPPAQSIDQRLKMPALMNLFEQQGGHLHVGPVDVADLDDLTAEHDLCIVAAGKGAISGIFEVNCAETAFSAPQRHLAMAYIEGTSSDEPLVNFNVVPDIGEFISYPALSVSGRCQILLFESVPDGPADIWRAPDGRWLRGAGALHCMNSLLNQYFSTESARVRGRQLIDENAAISGGFRPVVRHPVATLPSGRAVVGMGDVVVLNDPITAQGANNAVKCARIYADAILGHTGRFDEQFMAATFDKYWEIAGPATHFTTQFLGSSPAHAQELHAAAVHRPEVATRFGTTMDDPRDAENWILSPDKARRYLDSLPIDHAI